MKIDKKRKNKASNDDWENPHDPDAKIGMAVRTWPTRPSTRWIGRKSHSAVLAVTLQGANLGEPTTLIETNTAARENLAAVAHDVRVADKQDASWMDEAITDKGYHSNDAMITLAKMNIRSYAAEPQRGRRDWTDVPDEVRDAVYANLSPGVDTG